MATNTTDMAASENTRKRQSNSRIIDSTCLPSKIVKQNYALNIEKSLEKKLNAAKRAKNLSYEYPHGGVVATADAATYQLIKISAIHFDEQYPTENGMAHVIGTTDNTGRHIIQNTIRVTSASNNEREYTINFYQTTLKMIVNGKNVHKFMHEDLSAMHNIIRNAMNDNKNIDVKNMNSMLEEQLENLISNIKNRKQQNHTKTHEINKVDVNCIKCNRSCRTKSFLL